MESESADNEDMRNRLLGAARILAEATGKMVEAARVIVITFYSRSCLGQETAKGPFGLRVKLPPAHLSTTHRGAFTLSL